MVTGQHEVLMVGQYTFDPAEVVRDYKEWEEDWNGGGGAGILIDTIIPWEFLA